MSGQYFYTARTRDGKPIRGAIRAVDDTAVASFLRARSLIVTGIAADGATVAAALGRLRRRPVSRRTQTVFFGSFATLMRAGVAIGRALEITLARTPDDRFAETLRSTLADVEAGFSLAAALERRGGDFPPLSVAMIRAGEAAGQLDDVLERIAAFAERDADIRAKLRAALAYPAVVVASALALCVLLVTYVLPMFADVFAGFGVSLPAPTRALMAVAAIARTPQPWLAIAAVGAGSAVAVRRVRREARAALTLDRLRRRIPVAGPLLHATSLARVTRTVAMLLRAGVELTSALDVVVPVAGSAVLGAQLAAVQRSVRDGSSFAAALDAAGFDPLVTALAESGEAGGRLEPMLASAADAFERDVVLRIATLTAVVEPVLIVVLGTIVGAIVSAIFVPLYSLATAAGR